MEDEENEEVNDEMNGIGGSDQVDTFNNQTNSIPFPPPLNSHNIREESREQEFAVGIDEAGRGPVLGPMVYAAAYCLVSEKEAIKKMGYADSKTLTERQREVLFGKILSSSNFGFIADPIYPEELSRKMLKINKINLNKISHDSAADLIRRVLATNINLKEVYVDTVGPPQKYQALLSQQFPQLKIIVSKKADSLFPIVSAASICAKVIRDSLLRNWQFKESNPAFSTRFGSGYPSDPNTKTWLQNHVDPVFGFPSVIRFSWRTCDDLLDSCALPVVWGKYENANVDQYGILKFTKSSDRGQRYRFFAENNMEVVTDW